MRSKPLEDWRPSFGWVGVGVQWGNSFAYVTSFKFVAWDFDGSLAHMFPPYLGISRLVRVWFSSFRVSRSEMRSSESSAFCFPNPTLTNQSRAVRRFLHLKISVEEHRNRNKICRILLTLLVKACISRHKTTISSSLEDSFCSVWVTCLLSLSCLECQIGSITLKGTLFQVLKEAVILKQQKSCSTSTRTPKLQFPNVLANLIRWKSWVLRVLPAHWTSGIVLVAFIPTALAKDTAALMHHGLPAHLQKCTKKDTYNLHPPVFRTPRGRQFT